MSSHFVSEHQIYITKLQVVNLINCALNTTILKLLLIENHLSSPKRVHQLHPTERQPNSACVQFDICLKIY